jgi:hypothetical protein
MRPAATTAIGVLAGVLASACFTPPSAAVQFSCDLDGASACPPGYTCQTDGCCHRNGTDPEANAGACRLGAQTGTTGTGTGTDAATEVDSDTTEDAATDSDAATGPDSDTTGSAGTDSDASTGTDSEDTTGAQTGTSTGTGTGG